LKVCPHIASIILGIASYEAQNDLFHSNSVITFMQRLNLTSIIVLTGRGFLNVEFQYSMHRSDVVAICKTTIRSLIPCFS